MTKPLNRDYVRRVSDALAGAETETSDSLARTLLNLSTDHLDRRIGWWAAQEFAWTVQAGPFRGMRLHEAWHETLAACILGTYEQEIGGWVEELVASRPVQVIDIGSGDGYYAAGLALRLPEAAIVAADTEPRAQAGSRAQAQLNGVADRVTVMGAVSPSELARLLVPGGAVFCDCEGYEDVLLEPAAVPLLRRATIIVELHDFITAGVSDRIVARFADTHRVELRQAEMRDGLAEPLVAHLPPIQRFLAVNEGRPPMQWARLTPR